MLCITVTVTVSSWSSIDVVRRNRVLARLVRLVEENVVGPHNGCQRRTPTTVWWRGRDTPRTKHAPTLPRRLMERGLAATKAVHPPNRCPLVLVCERLPNKLRHRCPITKAEPSPSVSDDVSWVRRLAHPHPAQTVSCVHHTPHKILPILEHHPTVLLAIDGFMVQLSNCEAPSANMASNLLTSGALPYVTAKRMSD